MKSDLKKEIMSHLEELIGKTKNQSVEVSIETKLRPLQTTSTTIELHDPAFDGKPIDQPVQG